MSPRRKSPTIQPENQNAGSPPSGEPAFLAVGRLRRPHGVHGEIILEILTDFPERLRPGREIYVGDEHLPIRIESVRQHDQVLLITLSGYTDPESVGKLRNKLAYDRTDRLPELPEGEYYHHQLMGLKAIDEGGKLIGTLTDILETGANDVYVVKPDDGEEILLPAIESVILKVDLDAGEIHVRLPEWT